MRSESLDRRIGKAIQGARRRKRWTLKSLGKRCHYSRSMLSQIESGKNSVSIHGLVRLMKFLPLDLGILLQTPRWKVCPACEGAGIVKRR